MKLSRLFVRNVRNAIQLRNNLRQLLPLIKKTKETLFTRHLLATNLIISMSFSGLGDMIEQVIEVVSLNEPAVWDRVRSAKLATTGLTVGVVAHYWYIYLDKRYRASNHSTVFKKILLSQLIFAPVCILVFFLTLGFLNKTRRDEIWFNILNKGKRMYIADWLVWTPSSFVNFYFVPLKYRLLYDSVVSLGFDVYSSYVYHRHPVKFVDSSSSSSSSSSSPNEQSKNK